MATLTAIFTAQDNLSKAMQNAGNAGSKTSGIMQKLGKIGSVAMKGIITAVTAAATALLALGKNAITAGMNFESSMSQVMATMGINKSTAEGQKAYDTLSAAAQKMGAETAYSATQAADALNYLALAGYSADQAAEALPTVLYLAGAGAMDLAAASDLVTDAMAALQMEVNQTNLNKFADQLAKTASTTNTSVAQLGDAILTVGATAANLANGTTELNTQLGILANVGIKGAEAGTHLRNILLRLQNPTEKAAKALNKLGVNVYDSNGNMRDTGAIFNDLKTAMAGMNQQEIDQIMSTIFNKTDLAAAQALLAGAGDEYARIFSIIENSGGAAAEMYMTMLDNLKGDVDMFKSATEALYLSLYTSINGTLRDLVQTGTEYMNRLNEAFKAGGFTGLANELGNVLGDAVGVIMSYAPKLVEAGTDIVIAFVESIGNNADIISRALVDIALALGNAVIKIAPKLAEAFVKIVAAAGKALTRAIPKIFNAIPEKFYNALGLDKAQVMSKVTNFANYFRDVIRKVFSGNFMGAVDSLGKALGLDEGQISKIKNAVTQLASTFERIKSAALAVAKAIAQFVGKFASIGGIQAVLAGIAAAMIALKVINIGQTFSQLAQGIQKAGGVLKLLSANKFTLIAAAIGALVAAGVLLYKNWDKVSASAKKVGAAIKKAFENIGKKMSKWFGDVKSWASEKWDSFREAWANGDVGGWMRQQVNGLGQKMKGWFGDVKNWAAQKWNDLKNAWNGSKVGQWFNKTFKGIGQKLGEWFGPVGNWASEKWGQIKDAWNGSKVGQWFNKQFSGIGKKLGEWFGPIGTWASEKWEEIKTAWNNGTIGDWFADQFTGLGAKLGEWFGPAAEWASTKWEEIKAAWNNSNVGQWFNDQFSGIGAKLGEWFGSAAEWASTKWDEIKNAFNNGDPLGFFTDAFSGIGDKFSEWFGDIQSALETISPIIESIATPFKETFSGLGDAIKGVKDKFEELGPKFQEIGQKLGPALLVIGKVVLGVFGAIVTVVIGAVNGIISAIAPIAQAFVGMFGVVLDVISAVLSVITGDFAGAFESIKSAFTGLVGVFGSVAQAIGNFFSGIWSVVSTVASSIAETFASTFANVRSFISNLFAGIVNGIIGALNAVIQQFAAFLQWAAGAVNWIPGVDIQVNIPEIPELVVEGEVDWQNTDAPGGDGTNLQVTADTSAADSAIQTTLDNLNNLAAPEIPAIELDTSAADAALATTQSASDSLAESLAGFEMPDLSGAASGLEGISSTITEASSGITALESDLGSLESVFSGLDLGASGSEAGTSFVTGLQGADPSGAASQFASSVSSAVGSTVGGAFSSAGTDAANEFGTSLQTTAAGITLEPEGTNVATTFVTGMTAGMPPAVDSMTTTGEAIRAAAQAVNLSAQGRYMLQTLTQGMNSGRGAAVGSARATGNAIRSAFASINLYSTGVNIMQGLLNGMRSMFSSLMAEARRMAAQLKATIQSGMQVASPSKFTTWIGEMTGQGLINGIENMTAKAAAAAANMTAGVRDAMTPTSNAATPRTPTVSPYEALAGNGGGNNTSNGGSSEKRIVIDVTGNGQIEVTGISKERAAEMIANQIKPKLMEILAREIYTGGVRTYEY